MLRKAMIGSLLVCAAAIASPRLEELFGELTRTEESVFTAAATQPLPARAPTTAPRGEILLNASVQKIVNVIGRPISNDATTYQRENYNALREQDIDSIVRKMPGNAVKLSFRIVDITERPRPRPPKDPGKSASPEKRRAYLEAMSHFETELLSIEIQPLVAVGELDLKVQSTAAKPSPGKSFTQEMALLNAEIASLKRRLLDSDSDSDRKRLRSQLDAKEARKRSLVRSQGSASKDTEDSTGSDDFVYVMGTAETFGKWKKNQHRAAVAWIERVMVQARGTTRSDAKVTVDAVLRILEDAEDTAPESPTDKTAPDAESASTQPS